MNTVAHDFYAQAEALIGPHASDPLHERYHQLGVLLSRILRERTYQSGTEYSGDTARMHALCQQHRLPSYHLSVLLHHVIEVRQQRMQPTAQVLLYDVKALCQAISAFYSEPVPATLTEVLPVAWQQVSRSHDGHPRQRIRTRLLVHSWDSHTITGINADSSDTDTVTAIIPETGQTGWHLSQLLYEGAQVNLLHTSTLPDGRLQPRHIILEPDYLVDITSICQCYRPQGTSPIHHLMHRMLPAPQNLYLQTGNAANQFLDDCIHHSSGEVSDTDLYLQSMQHVLHEYALPWITLPGITAEYFTRTRQQFQHIREIVDNVFPTHGIDARMGDVRLETSFLCEPLGLLGRMDLLTTDHRHIVELKSGRAEERGDMVNYKQEHAIQMALYKEILAYNGLMNRADVSTMLLYSHYPMLFDIRLGQADIAQAIWVRNGIIWLERQLRQRDSMQKLLKNITVQTFNPSGRDDARYHQWIEPEIEQFVRCLTQASPIARDYLSEYLPFMQREQFLARMGDGRPDSDRGFAQVWQTDTRTKQERGNLIIVTSTHQPQDEGETKDYTFALEPTSTADASAQDGMCETMYNLRAGDNVMLYAPRSEQHTGPQTQYFRATIAELTTHSITLHMRYEQPGRIHFPPGTRCCIEPLPQADTSPRALYSLLTCPPHRQQLILGQRPPLTDESITLSTDIENAELRQIITHAMQATDYYLLVGPPGTGKTSVALSNMVRELLQSHPDENILLMAYTNRAVDEICQMLEQLQPSPHYMRMGNELSCDPQYRPHLMRQQIAPLTTRAQIRQALLQCHVVCGTVATLSGMTELFQLKQFQTAILDEASQVLEPQMMPLLTMQHTPGQVAIERFIMIGDHKQLPAVVAQSRQQSTITSHTLLQAGILNCADSLFERLHRQVSAWGLDHCVGLLHRQGRMHPALSTFVNNAYYGGKLDIVPLPHQLESLQWQDATDYVATTRMGFIDVQPAPTHNLKANQPEALQVALIVQRIHQLCTQAGLPFDPIHRIGIIVPFRAQITLIRHQLQALNIPQADLITIDTVERYQGSQRDIIIFSTVIIRPYQLAILSSPVPAEGVMVDRKLNVAITRARCQFFLVGNLTLLRQAPAYRDLLESYSESGK